METKSASGPHPHLMRVMLIQNVAVDQRFANGAPPQQVDEASLPPMVWPYPSKQNKPTKAPPLFSSFSHTYPIFPLIQYSCTLSDVRHLPSLHHHVPHGSQGRLLHWHPEATETQRKALPAYSPDLSARFCKESALSKTEMMPDMDFMDLGACQEHLNVRGEPIMQQLCVVPAYALTVRSPVG